MSQTKRRVRVVFVPQIRKPQPICWKVDPSKCVPPAPLRAVLTAFFVVVTAIWVALREFQGSDSSYLIINGGDRIYGAGRYYYSPRQMNIENASITWLEGTNACDPPAGIAGQIVVSEIFLDNDCSFGDWHAAVVARGGVAAVLLVEM